MFLSRLLPKADMVSPQDALRGRPDPIPTADRHAVLGTPLKGPFPAGLEVAEFGLGCFWGAERLFWELGDGIHTTAVGYSGGYTPNPTYEEACSGRTGHAETVLVVFDPQKISYEQLLKTFWEGHDPTQGNRQGNDVGSQYRSIVLTHSDEQAELAAGSRARYQEALAAAGHGAQITTEIQPAGEFFYAEDYHQQYLHKVPNGYCGLGGTGVSCPVGLTPAT
jgi:peptide-methionine (S)-S-oxide reductase